MDLGDLAAFKISSELDRKDVEVIRSKPQFRSTVVYVPKHGSRSYCQVGSCHGSSWNESVCARWGVVNTRPNGRSEHHPRFGHQCVLSLIAVFNSQKIFLTRPPQNISSTLILTNHPPPMRHQTQVRDVQQRLVTRRPSNHHRRNSQGCPRKGGRFKPNTFGGFPMVSVRCPLLHELLMPKTYDAFCHQLRRIRTNL